MTHKLPSWGGLVILLFTFFLLTITPAQAQTPAPNFANFTVAVWPEFDQPEVLVVYRMQLDSSVALPAQVSLRLPGYIEETHAVAVGGETGLVTVPPANIQMQPEGDTLLLSFPVTSARVQVEYYDPFILTRDGVERQLNYNFVAPYELDSLTVEIQEPFQAQNFAVTPPPTDSFTGSDNLRYHTVQVQDIAAGTTVPVIANYQRSTDQLTVQGLQAAAATGSAAAPVIPAPTVPTETAEAPYLAYALLGAGFILLLGSGGYWWLQRHRDNAAAQTAPRRQPGRRKAHASRPTSRPSPPVPADAQSAGAARYCYSCGTALRDDANFCHICGAERRTN